MFSNFQKQPIILLLFSIIISSTFGCSAPLSLDYNIDNSEQQNQQELFSYQKKIVEGYLFHILVLDPKNFTFSILQNEKPPKSKSIGQIHRESKNLISVNGSFFSPEFEPLGLLISNEKTLNRTTKSELSNGIFYLTDQSVGGMIPTEQFEKILLNNKVQFGIQNGPMILNDKGQNMISVDTFKKAGRTLIGLNEENKVIIIVNNQSLLKNQNPSLYELGEILQKSATFQEMKLHSVLNLDGGSSSGIAIKDEYFPELEMVQNIIAINEK